MKDIKLVPLNWILFVYLNLLIIGFYVISFLLISEQNVDT